MTVKEQLDRRVSALEKIHKPLKVGDLSDDQLAEIIVGKPYKAANVTNQHLIEIIFE
jgi:hypothetical protein